MVGVHPHLKKHPYAMTSVRSHCQQALHHYTLDHVRFVHVRAYMHTYIRMDDASSATILRTSQGGGGRFQNLMDEGINL